MPPQAPDAERKAIDARWKKKRAEEMKASFPAHNGSRRNVWQDTPQTNPRYLTRGYGADQRRKLMWAEKCAQKEKDAAASAEVDARPWRRAPQPQAAAHDNPPQAAEHGNPYLMHDNMDAAMNELLLLQEHGSAAASSSATSLTPAHETAVATSLTPVHETLSELENQALLHLSLISNAIDSDADAPVVEGLIEKALLHRQVTTTFLSKFLDDKADEGACMQ